MEAFFKGGIHHPFIRANGVIKVLRLEIKTVLLTNNSKNYMNCNFFL